MINTKIALVAVAIALTGIAGCSKAAPASAVEQVVEAAGVVSGAFEGRNDHITTGTASIVGAPGSYSLVFSNNFELDGAPDPIIGFGHDGTFDISTKVGALDNRTGAQSYALPASFDPAANSEVYVWCEKFDVALGVAELK